MKKFFLLPPAPPILLSKRFDGGGNVQIAHAYVGLMRQTASVLCLAKAGGVEPFTQKALE